MIKDGKGRRWQWSKKFGMLKLPSKQDVIMRSDMGFEPDEEYEYAKQKVANMLELPEWNWLKSQISYQKLTWVEIFDLLGSHT